MPDNTEQIAELDEIINAAETSTTVDGVSSTVDLEAARLARRELMASHVGPNGEKAMVRRMVKRINLSR